MQRFDEKESDIFSNFESKKNEILRPIEPIAIEENLSPELLRPFTIRKRRGDFTSIVEKMISYHFRGAKANEIRSKF